MRKDEVITLCDFAEDGTLIAYSPRFRNPELAPLEYKSSENYLRKWWENRQIPLRQGGVAEMLRKRGLAMPSEFLLRNLGLSLSDYYWIKPVDSALRWSQVNLFDNDFKDNLLEPAKGGKYDESARTPNSSLRGELEKTWIIRNGKRVLVKGNHGKSSAESINEVIATELHRRQGYDNYTPYRLVKIKDKPYDFACYSEAFTSNELEFVSAYALLTSEKKPSGMTDYEFLIMLAVRSGIDEDLLRRDLEYQIMSDYVLSNVDRHMENIGFLRDSETLKFVRMAPIFDNGKAFGGGGVIPYTDEEISDMEINSFEDREASLLNYVTDKSVFDASKALPSSRIEELYRKDSKAKDSQIKNTIGLYEKKLDKIIKFQGPGK